MNAPRGLSALAAAIAVCVVAALSGCSLGPEAKGKGASLLVTRDFGAVAIERASEPDLPKGETAMRLLQRSVDVETRYGGRFVSAVEDLSSSTSGAERRDWFYYVNGIEADVSAAEKRLHDGDRVWWDHRRWDGAMRVAAVVGSYPEPFVHGQDGKRYPVRIDCAEDASDACAKVARRLDEAGATPSTTALGTPAGEEVLRLVVGVWSDAREDAAARRLEEGPGESGVFARLGPGAGGTELLLLDELGRVGRRLAGGAGLVAATRLEEQQPTWVVTGVDELGLGRAVDLLEERRLRDRFAVATNGRQDQRLPVGVER